MIRRRSIALLILVLTLLEAAACTSSGAPVSADPDVTGLEQVAVTGVEEAPNEDSVGGAAEGPADVRGRDEVVAEVGVEVTEVTEVTGAPVAAAAHSRDGTGRGRGNRRRRRRRLRGWGPVPTARRPPCRAAGGGVVAGRECAGPGRGAERGSASLSGVHDDVPSCRQRCAGRRAVSRHVLNSVLVGGRVRPSR